jgi:hypothetical protein
MSGIAGPEKTLGAFKEIAIVLMPANAVSGFECGAQLWFVQDG